MAIGILCHSHKRILLLILAIVELVVTPLAGNPPAATAESRFTTALAGFQESIVFSGLEAPTVVAFSRDGRVFVAEKSGIIKVFDSIDATASTVFADLRTNVHNFWDRGLLGMALHPNFPETPYVYVLYTFDAPIGGAAPTWGVAGETSDDCPTPPGPVDFGCVASGRLSRLRALGNEMVPGSEEVLINDWFQQFPGHSVGGLAFDNDGALYASGGEGANFLYADYGQDGNPGGDPPDPDSTSLGPPTAEGGALRSQDLRTRTDPLGLNGTVIRIDPDTGLNLPDNPLAADPELNARRIVGYGFRAPFRIANRPGTHEIWVGDVGWNTSEEINRIAGAGSPVENFGWPCYEGAAIQETFADLNLNLCDELYSSPRSTTLPYFSYDQGAFVVPGGDACGDFGITTSGLAFYSGSKFPAEFDGALFFADYSRQCIWSMLAGADGLPDRSTVAVFQAGTPNPVDLKVHDGDLYYLDVLGGTLRRIRFLGGSQSPRASISASTTSGAVPLLVSFDASASTDPEGGSLLFSWDLNGDGVFDDSTEMLPTFTFDAAGIYNVSVRVTDSEGLFDTASLMILAGDVAYPEPVISSPLASLRWGVGDVISFSGSATDANDGVLPPTALSWSLVMHHCAPSCHAHPIQDFASVSSGSFVAPDHEYFSYLELRLTATDSSGLQKTTSTSLVPATVEITMDSVPSGLRLTLGSRSDSTPFTRTIIQGGSVSIGAPTTQFIGTTAHTFATWSDGGAASHITGAINAPVTFRATYGGRANVALAANGATATASSTYGGGFEPSGMIDGDREGQSWGSGGGLNDATPDEWPDWVEVAFAGTRTINEVDVFSVQDDYGAPTAPTAGMTFSLYGLTDFAVEYWDGTEWTAVPGGVVNGNSLVWRQITFAPLTTTKIRVWVTGALGGYSRITEVEAYQAASAPRVNVALASGGATATGSSTFNSDYDAGAAIDGSREGLRWGSGGGWNDGTASVWPDWLEVALNGTKTIDEVDVFTVQDAFASPDVPTPAMTFSLYGLREFTVEYWNGAEWLPVPGGAVSENSLVWRQITFAPLATSKIRVWMTGALADYSRITEVEAYQVVESAASERQQPPSTQRR